MSIVSIDSYRNNTINLNALRASGRQLAAGLIAPSAEDYTPDVVEDHAAEPIKSLDDIDLLCSHMLSKGRYRDYMMFIVGINFGLRASDLRMLRFSDLINPNCTFKESFPVFEIKTRNTRKRKKNRYITINQAVIEAVTLFLEHTPGVSLSDYMFRSESNRGKDDNVPIAVRSMEYVLKKNVKEVGLDIHVSTHSLRKTFCYHQMLMSHNDSRKLLLLQKMLNHSSPAQTLDYIGITAEEIDEAYKNLNLGSRNYNYMICSRIYEKESEAM